MNATSIEWTDLTWSPTRGCSRVSPGCVNCYAERMAARFSNAGRPFWGVACRTPQGPRWTGRVELIESKLVEPLRRRRWAETFLREHGRKPRVFLNSMSDLFHESLPDEAIDRVFAVMALAPWFDFLALTKRAERMLVWSWSHGSISQAIADVVNLNPTVVLPAMNAAADFNYEIGRPGFVEPWPLPNVRLGVSVEDQQRADERRPHLMQLAAQGWKTWCSLEPLLSPVHLRGEGVKIGWLIIGGESGPGARPCDLSWIRGLRNQALQAATPCYVKQLGSNVRCRNDNGFEGDTPTSWPMDTRVEDNPDGYRDEYQGAPVRVRLRHPRGGDPSEWPKDLRIREEPQS